MKKQFFLVILLVSVQIYAQEGGFNYKAIITDSGAVLADHAITIQFTLLENGSTTVYQETHSTTTDTNGIVNVSIGEGSTSDDFSTIDWATNPIFLQVEIDTGSGYVDFGTTAFKAVPYAKYAEEGGSVTSLDDLSDARLTGNSVFVGNGAGANDDGTDNSNTAIGEYALEAVSTGTSNNAFGSNTLKNNTIGQDNIAIGLNALRSNTSGSHNVVIGSGAGLNSTVGSNNVFVGANAGFNETGSNKLYIENSQSSNPLIGGDFSTDEVNINGSLTIAENGGDAILTIHDSDAGNERPGIRFTNNTSQFISGDDESDETFGFYSTWGATRTFDALVRVYGKAASSWGTYLEMTHDGDHASIRTDVGNINISPAENVVVNKKIISEVSGNNDMKAYAYGNINWDGEIIAASDNVSINLTAIGTYELTFTGTTYSDDDFICMLTSINGIGFITHLVNDNKLIVKTYTAGEVAISKDFSFVVYKK